MRFAVANCSRYKEYISYKPILENYNLETIKVVDEYDEEITYELFHININSLEELIELKNKLGHKLIMQDYFYDETLNYYEEPTIKIYDGYNE